MFIFRVDTGTMFVLDGQLAAKTVSQLKEAIEEHCHIAVDKQVLLVSGGEVLDPSAMVCSYSAGTDTNPIYLFSKVTDENRPLSPSSQYPSDCELTSNIERSLDMPPTYSTVVERTALAHQVCEMGRDICIECERLVHEQHLQQQGWAAAVAHFDDISALFKEFGNMFSNDYKAYLVTREECLDALNNFEGDVETLEKIPILTPLLFNALTHSGLECTENITEMNLLQWISAKDTQSNLHAFAEQCYQILEQFDEDCLQTIMQSVENTLSIASNPSMKEIQGLSERLFSLEQLKMTSRKILQQQVDLAHSFAQNQSRVGNLGDPSILPDLCSMHRSQLIVLIENHTKLKDQRRRALRAKNELSGALYHRLRWVAYAQTEVQKVRHKIMLYQENLKRARKSFVITKQIQSAPELYCMAVAETVRRRKFSAVYAQWAADLSRRLLATYNEESERRREFKERFGDHFLVTLFPGLEDDPPNFGIKPPEGFDTALPELTIDDMEKLREILPDLALDVSFIELSNIAQMFLDKSIKSDSMPVEEGLVAAVTQAVLDGEQQRESLPEGAEGFEKVSLALDEKKEDEESKELTISELTKLRHQIATAGMVASSLASSLRAELSEIRSRTDEDRSHILTLVKLIQSHIAQLTEGFTNEVFEMQKRLEDVEESSRLDKQRLELDFREKQKILEEALTADLEKLKLDYDRINKEKDDLSIVFKETSDKCVNMELRMSESEKEAQKELEQIVNTYELRISGLINEAAKNQENWITEKELLEEKWKKECDEILCQAMAEKKAVELTLEEKNQEIQRILEENAKQLNSLQEKILQTEVDCEKRCHTLEEEQAKEFARLRLDAEADMHRLVRDHKMEIENLRSRYRLMASVDKSPSDSSLEKIDGGMVVPRTPIPTDTPSPLSLTPATIEVSTHEAIIAQTLSDAELSKEAAVVSAVEEERASARARMTAERQVWLDEAVARACAEKDRQLETLLQRNQALSTECQRHRDTIRLLTDGDHLRHSGSVGKIEPMMHRIEELEKEKTLLENEVSTLRKEPMETSMTQSVSVVTESTRDAATSPDSSKGCKPSTSKSSGSRSYDGRISVTSCQADDPVLVVWNMEHSNYMILQESPTLFFLHPECLDVLGLRPASDGSPRRLYTTAVVVNKEYCHARKAENRYRVPLGTKFYRVIVKPLTREKGESAKATTSTS